MGVGAAGHGNGFEPVEFVFPRLALLPFEEIRHRDGAVRKRAHGIDIITA
jgi:hypothetical protein